MPFDSIVLHGANQHHLQTIKQERPTIKRERAETNPLTMRPLKSSKGANGQTIYHLDSDDEDAAPPQRNGNAHQQPSVEDEIDTITL